MFIHHQLIERLMHSPALIHMIMCHRVHISVNRNSLLVQLISFQHKCNFILIRTIFSRTLHLIRENWQCNEVKPQRTMFKGSWINLNKNSLLIRRGKCWVFPLNITTEWTSVKTALRPKRALGPANLDQASLLAIQEFHKLTYEIITEDSFMKGKRDGVKY